MTIEALIIWLVIGGIAGWLAGLIVKGYGLGLIGNIVVGIVGAVIAGWLLPRIGLVIGGGFIAAIINAVIGAVILLLVIGFAVRAGHLALDRSLLQSFAKFVAAGIVLAAALWFAARFAGSVLAQMSAFRDEAMLGVLVVVGTLVYAASVLVLFGRRWLLSLVR
jgi:uncharacterized membrane protein YeaQ/YmgE (transglycosylase-associated protein family)